MLLLDEPLGALDKQLREEMQLELRALQRTVGITFVFVAHDQEEALTMSDRIAVMSRGRYLQIDTPTQLYEAPQNREVAAFIGTMNFFEAQVLEVTDGQVSIDAGPLGRLSSLPSTRSFTNGDKLLAAIRPEKFTLLTERPDTGNSVGGTMDDAAYLGDRSHYYVQVHGLEKPVAVSAQNMGQPQGVVDSGKRKVWLTWRNESVVLLERD